LLEKNFFFRLTLGYRRRYERKNRLRSARAPTHYENLFFPTSTLILSSTTQLHEPLKLSERVAVVTKKAVKKRPSHGMPIFNRGRFFTVRGGWGVINHPSAAKSTC